MVYSNVSNLPRKPKLQPFEPFSPAKWHGLSAPPYDWMVDGCLLRGTVGIISGDGGLGKSLLMQQLCTATALGKQWLGLDTKPCKSLAFFCEDDEDELHRRQEAICRHYDAELGDMENSLYVSRAGMDNILCNFDRKDDTAQPTPVWDQLRTAAKDFGAELVILDTAADVFGGNEIFRQQVRRFISLLRALAIELQGAVILTMHPSTAGMSTGTGLSGSTAWNNSVRSRLYLTRPKPQQGEDEDDQDANERFLKTMKNNQGPFGGRIRLRWNDGVFLRTDVTDGAPANFIDKLDVDNKLVEGLRYLVKNGSRVTADMSAKSAFANVLRKLPSCQHLSYSAVASAQQRLMDQGRIVCVEMGPPSKRVVYLRTPDTLYPGESGRVEQ